MRYTTRQDAIEHDIIPALGDHAADYDIDGIFREAYEWRIDTDTEGNELLNTGGFEAIVDEEQFWEIAQRHDTTA